MQMNPVVADWSSQDASVSYMLDDFHLPAKLSQAASLPASSAIINNHPTAHDELLGGDLTLNLDSGLDDFSIWLAPPPDTVPDRFPPGQGYAPPPTNTSSRGGEPEEAFSGDAMRTTPLIRKEIWIRRISRINIKLYQHGADIISESAPVKPSSPSKVDSNERKKSPSLNKEVPLDRTFVITTEFLQILDEMAPSKKNEHTAGAWKQTKQSDCFPLDHDTIILLLSCYLRLLDIYASILHQLRYIASSTSRPIPSAHDSTPSLPRLSFGSFDIAPFSPLFLSLIVHLVERLLKCAHDAVWCIDDSLTTARKNLDELDEIQRQSGHRAGENEARVGGLGMWADIISATFEMVRGREREVQKFNTWVKNDLLINHERRV